VCTGRGGVTDPGGAGGDRTATGIISTGPTIDIIARTTDAGGTDGVGYVLPEESSYTRPYPEREERDRWLGMGSLSSGSSIPSSGLGSSLMDSLSNQPISKRINEQPS
jgi:hypothetical protein